MTFAELANKGILTQPVYEPGKPIDQVARELGLDPAGIVKLASNENPFGPSPKAMAAITRCDRSWRPSGASAWTSSSSAMARTSCWNCSATRSSRRAWSA